MRLRLSLMLLGLLPIAGLAQSAPMVERSQRPPMRPGETLMPQPRPSASPDQPAATAGGGCVEAFDAWRADFRARALVRGVPPRVFDEAMGGVRPEPEIIARDRSQSEFSRAIWDYLDSAVSASRVRAGRAALARHRRLLEAIERRYRVEKEIVAAIWGLESSYGAVRGDVPVFTALATLACEGRRRAFFEAQLIDALRILQTGEVQRARMTGSWAGAMGHTQFMPTAWLRFAQDFDADGRRDIWGDDPADALASTAAYLAAHGWQRGQPWGLEVRLPGGFDYRLTSERVKKPVSAWMALGVRDVRGAAVAEHGPASILLPAGHRGPAFMIFENFHVLESYNTADAYVIAVGHLADRLRGGGPIRHPWPRSDGVLQPRERLELQQRLTAAGFDTGGIDGIIGPRTIAAVQAWQAATGQVPDGYASPAALARLR
ncbi:MAG: lytic murein transglycosylase [Alphaproteobacteria bacterium]|nr:MAG: lytic murein transglycosylase [Alphaproteobacteria bacterium]